MRAILLFLTVAATAVPVAAQQNGGSANGGLTCTAFAASTGGPRSSPVATVVDIVVERWSTNAQRQRLFDALKEGQNAMLEALRDLPRVGYIRTPQSLGWDLHYAQVSRGDEGDRRIVIATDRPIGFWEAANRPRTIDYPFTFIELRLDGEGRGQGKMSVATQVYGSGEGRFVQLENYDGQPVQLNEVTCR
jgi:hypothetical protein